MKVYQCIFTDTEVVCDNNQTFEEEDDVVYVVKGKMMEIGGEDFGLAANVDEDAAEGATAEGAADSKQKVVDVVYNNRLQETGYDKKSFGAYIKGYMGKLKEHVEKTEGEEAAKKFMAGAATFVKKILKDFDEVQFFLPPLHEDADPDQSIVVLSLWKDEVPVFYFWKHGLKGIKV
jgi:hypothetical protein